jgi:hypothetical protein
MQNKPNRIKFILEDNTNKDQYNQSCTFEKKWYGADDTGEVLSIEEYYYRCREFAATMGFCEKTINEWFGDF